MCVCTHLEGLVGGIDGDRNRSDVRHSCLQSILILTLNVNVAGLGGANVCRLELALSIL